ncbi:hypothetical protein PoB_005774100 [Plakobranchus ocellatus]|uniref:Uncharacterized protein n=1 Tax=Plakobranchus ocellatus TaxID=259542 RepID=A0AAV4CEP3_9GAST|nr:hypothetical protein PoB_005774100 [Plakobranchus ocellatus]
MREKSITHIFKQTVRTHKPSAISHHGLLSLNTHTLHGPTRDGQQSTETRPRSQLSPARPCHCRALTRCLITEIDGRPPLLTMETTRERQRRTCITH